MSVGKKIAKKMTGRLSDKVSINDPKSREWATKPRSQSAVDLMFSDPPMYHEIAIATKAGYIVGNKWIPENRRVVNSREPGEDDDE